MSERSLYAERRLLRGLERLWTRGERLINRLSSADFNSFYHLGTFGIFLLIVITVTGIYLTIFYRPGTERAYISVAGMSATWLGSLLRSVHRYASDGLALVIFIHALKVLIGDRFWGSRWVAWVTGWLMLVIIAVIGVMGYWLVWDQRAQWLTEYWMGLLQGPFALSFLSPEIASRTYAFFVIILFLHVFIPILLVVGLLLHFLRLERAQLWSPRWLMTMGSVLLVAWSLWRPVASASPADLSRLVGTVSLDGWYLGFLPLVEQGSNLVFWGLLGLLLAVVVALPWLGRGRDLGPAVVGENFCSGCALCIGDCPYGALQLNPRGDHDQFEMVASVDPSLCTGCGLCVGTCSTLGIELAGLPSDVVVAGLEQSIAAAQTADCQPVAIFTCQRHATLGTLSDIVAHGARQVVSAPLHTASSPTGTATQFAFGSWGGGNPHPSVPIVTCALPCVSMAPNSWIKASLEAGARAVLMLSCPADDCAYREGPRWLSERIGRRRRSRKQRQLVQMLEVAPGDRGAVAAALANLTNGVLPPEPDGSASDDEAAAPGLLSKMRPLAAGLIVLALTLLLSVAFEFPATASTQEQGLLRIALGHKGRIIAESADLPPEIATKLPSNVSPVQVLGGERFPVHLRMEINGEVVIEETYDPGGLRREGAINEVESLWLAPGMYQVDLFLMDDETDWRGVFSDQVEVEAGRALNVIFDGALDTFVIH